MVLIDFLKKHDFMVLIDFLKKSMDYSSWFLF